MKSDRQGRVGSEFERGKRNALSQRSRLVPFSLALFFAATDPPYLCHRSNPDAAVRITSTERHGVLGILDWRQGGISSAQRGMHVLLPDKAQLNTANGAPSSPTCVPRLFRIQLPALEKGIPTDQFSQT